ncbi:MAG: flagellar export protein FliJ [Chromatiales bacterium]|nr:flagellar export protein FliJ [Chromatiales bacterium]
MRERNNLQVLHRLASHAETSRARKLATANTAVRTEEQRLAQIADYLSDYSLLTIPGGQSLSPAELLNRRRFVSRLGDALASQQSQLQRTREAAAREQQRWTAARSQVRALDQLEERRKETLERRAARREQKKLDDAGRHRGR